MKDIKITELLCAGFEAHEDELYKKINANKRYQKAQKTFSEHLETLRPNQSYISTVEDSEIVMETVAKDIAFDEGFKLAVRLILSSMS